MERIPNYAAIAGMSQEAAEAVHDGGNRGRTELKRDEDHEARLQILAGKAEHKPRAFAGAVSEALGDWAGPTWESAVSLISHGIRHGQYDDAELGRLVREGVTRELIRAVDADEVEEFLEARS